MTKKMIKTNQKIVINEANVFVNDLLDRKEAIKDLSTLIENQTEPLVLSVNADWGAGKTTFVQLWQAYLKQQKIESIYFSAWENDFSNEPLVAILGELNIYISNSKNKKVKSNFESTKKISAKILPTLIKLGANAVSGGMAGDVAEKTTKSLIDNYKANKDDLSKLKESIAKVLKIINPDKPFIIFIDELDRCKPLYAIELLERIKHIFDIERLIFVLSMDKNNLAKSIKSQYGNIDTNNYLRRFIHLEYPLKNPSVDKFCEVLFEKFELRNALNSKKVRYDYTYDLDLIQKLSAVFNLSLRQIEQIFTKLHIFFTTIPPIFHDAHLSIFILFECLKSYDSQYYDDFLAGKIPATEIQDIVLREPEQFEYIKTFIKAIIAITPLINDKKGREDFIKKQSDPKFIKFLNTGFSHTFGDLEDFIKTTIKHIDFANKFDFNINEQKITKNKQ